MPSKKEILKETSLVRLYRRAHRRHYPQTYLPPFTMKEKGQLGIIRKRLGDRANKVVYRAISKWRKFMDSLTDDEDKRKAMPKVPNVGFLLMHIDAADTF